MEILTLFGFAIVSIFCYGILRQYNGVYAILLSAVCGSIILIYIFNSLAPVIEILNSLSNYASFGEFGVIFKAVALAVISQFTTDLCKESGQVALASSVELMGKISIILISLPLIVSLSQIILQLLT